MSEVSESVDVIIPVYNGANFIEKAIESVMAQTNAIIGKIIVVNDGSSDATVSVIQAMNLPNLELITTPNRGVAAARNAGVAAAKSKWIAFLDADDYWHSDKLEKQLTMARQHKVSFICSATDLISKRTEGIISFVSMWKGNFISTSTVVMSRELAQEIKPLFRLDMTFAEDYATWFRILAVNAGYFTPQILSQYYVSPMPNYRLGSIFWNLMILQIECILFLLRGNIPVIRKFIGLLALVSGTSISIFSILKRFISAYMRKYQSPSIK